MLEFGSEFPKFVSLNGKIIQAKDAKVSVFDRAFIFGDAVYEGLLVVGGIILFEEAHWYRLQCSLRTLDIIYDLAKLKSIIYNYLNNDEVASESAFLYVQISRGIAMRGHQYPKDINPNVFVYSIDKEVPAINKSLLGVITTTDNRWHRCDIKMTSLLGNVMAKAKAIKSNCYESLMVRNGLVTEGSHCNVFFVKDGMVYTHPANHHILNGITRIKVLEICAELGIPFKEEAIEHKELNTIAEAFLTGTSTQIAQIQKIDNHTLEVNVNDSVTMKIQQAYLELKETYIRNAVK